MASVFFVTAMLALGCSAPDAASCPSGTCADAARIDAFVGLDAGVLDAGPGRPDVPDAAPRACRTVTSEPTLGMRPVDIIIVVDTSTSMGTEIAQVQDKLNVFVDELTRSDLDYHVVIIASRGMCVPPPLGTGPPACGEGTLGRLRIVDRAVGSNDAPERVEGAYSMFADYLRPGGVRHFLWITDDDAVLPVVFTPDEFRARLTWFDPPGTFDDVVHHAIVGYYGDTPATWEDSMAGSCDTLSRPGTFYLRLTDCLSDEGELVEGCTPGRRARVCETDWSPIFTDIARRVVEATPVACEVILPEPPVDERFDLSTTRVLYRPGEGAGVELQRRADRASCTADGWIFDDPDAPTKIALCPERCAIAQGDVAARIDVAIGCFSDLE